VPARLDIARLDVAVIDPEHQDQAHLGDEQDAEEEGNAAQRILPALLERQVVDLVDHGAQRIEGGQRDDARQDRVEAEPGAEEIGDVGAEDDEGGVGDVDDVENAERNRHPHRHRGIEAAEQQSGRHRIEQQVERKHFPPALFWSLGRTVTVGLVPAISTVVPPISPRRISPRRLSIELAERINTPQESRNQERPSRPGAGPT
jgi:hypothetical protein